MLKVVPWVHLIVMLRNPVDRAYSQYNMILDPYGTGVFLKMEDRSPYARLSLEEIVERELKEITEAGITANSSYAEFREKLLKTRPMKYHGGHSLLIRGMYALQLLPFFEQWPAERLKIVSMKDIQVRGLGEPK